MTLLPQMCQKVGHMKKEWRHSNSDSTILRLKQQSPVDEKMGLSYSRNAYLAKNPVLRKEIPLQIQGFFTGALSSIGEAQALRDLTRFFKAASD
jgi:hypothetical protein